MFLRFLFFGGVVVVAGCGPGSGGPAAVTVIEIGRPTAATVTGATTGVAAVHALSCWSNEDCGVNHTGGLCVPKGATKELADGEDFLARAMSLHDLVTRLGDKSSAGEIPTILQQVQADMSMYSQIAQGNIPSGADDGGASAVPGAQATSAQMNTMQDAAWMQSGATQADMVIRQLLFHFSAAPITADAQKVYADITDDRAGLHLDTVISDIQALLEHIEVALAQANQLVSCRMPDGSVPDLKSAAGALIRYVGPLVTDMNDARSRVKAVLDPSAIPQLTSDLTLLAHGHDLLGKDGNPGMCLGTP
jgi:hypothetical protein